MLLEFADELKNACCRAGNDGTFNDIVDEVFDKGDSVESLGENKEIILSSASKAGTIYGCIKDSSVGDTINIYNEDCSVWCVLKVICKEHPESEAKP